MPIFSFRHVTLLLLSVTASLLIHPKQVRSEEITTSIPQTVIDAFTNRVGTLSGSAIDNVPTEIIIYWGGPPGCGNNIKNPCQIKKTGLIQSVSWKWKLTGARFVLKKTGITFYAYFSAFTVPITTGTSGSASGYSGTTATYSQAIQLPATALVDYSDGSPVLTLKINQPQMVQPTFTLYGAPIQMETTIPVSYNYNVRLPIVAAKLNISGRTISGLAQNVGLQVLDGQIQVTTDVLFQ